MGTTQKNINKVIFDTDSAILALTTTDCTACKYKYDFTKSTAYLKVSSQLQELEYD